MQYSTHNIFSKIKDSDNYFIVNILSGNADILSPGEAENLLKMKENGWQNTEFGNQLVENGYFIDKKAEQKEYKNAYLDFTDSREEDEIQIFYVPNYTCNFACSYCYQDEYQNQNQSFNPEIIDSFFNYVQTEFSGRKKYITVFGGEPLMNSVNQKQIISYIINKANENKLSLSFVTNGYTLTEYIDLLKNANIREIQVTLDGTEKMHDSRRYLKGGSATFEKIVAGIDACLQHKLMVNLRMVIDKDNIHELPKLAAFAIEKGWTKNNLFKTQIGRNYELHHCQSGSGRLFSRVSLYEHIYELIKQFPYIIEFHKPAYSLSKFLAENGELPDPLFDSCPACKTEWAFDYTGNIYSCTATVGKSDESLGTFYPKITKKSDVIEEWENRDVTNIPECENCNLQLACGGGCGSVAKNKTGKICSPDCRPINELLEIGFKIYDDKG